MLASSVKWIDWEGQRVPVARGEYLLQLDPDFAQNKQLEKEYIKTLFQGATKSDEIYITRAFELKEQNVYWVKSAPIADENEVFNLVKAQKGVSYIQPNFIYFTQEENFSRYVLRREFQTCNEECQKLNGVRWNHQMTRAFEAYNLAMSSRQIQNKALVAVLDTGLFGSHPALKHFTAPHNIYAVTFYTGAKVYYTNKEYDPPIQGVRWSPEGSGWEPYTVTGGWHDWQGHGTHCAGMVAGTFQSNKNFFGTARGFPFIPIKILGDDGTGSSAIILQGVLYAKSQGAKVLSMSLGGPAKDGYSQRIYSEEIEKAGIITIAAAGNGYEAGNAPVYPGAFESTIAVASLGSDGAVAYYSQSHDWVDISAPGGDGHKKNRAHQQRQIFSTWTADPRAPRVPSRVPAEPGEDGRYYRGISGTSMSTPQVAGIVTLLKSIKPELTTTQVRKILQESGRRVLSSYHPKQIRLMPNLKSIDALAAVQNTLGNGGGTPGEETYKKIKLVKKGSLNQIELKLAYAYVSKNFGAYYHLKPYFYARDISEITNNALIFSFPSNLPFSDLNGVRVKFQFQAPYYIPERSIALDSLSSSGYLLYSQYSQKPYFKIFLRKNIQEKNFELVVEEIHFK